MDTVAQRKYKILLIGDNCTDVYQYGTVERISPEAPVPIFKYSHQESKMGMAGNVLLNLEALGCEVKFMTKKTCSVKTRLIDIRSKQQLLRIDNDANSEPLKLEYFDDWDYDAIVVSDYNKGVVSYELIEFISAHYSGPVFLDTKKTDLERFSGIYVKINESEYKNATSTNNSLIVTLGSKGAMFRTGPDDERYYGTPVVEVADVCGAGDTFLAAVTYKFLETQDIGISIMFANKASALTVQRIGNYAPKLEEIV